MGLYLNPGNREFKTAIDSDIYVDKTGLISYTNSRIGKIRPYICSIRPRRFGKSMAVQMLTAYYCKDCDSKSLFDGFEISKDTTYEKHLNKYDVIQLDMQWFMESDNSDFIRNIEKEVLRELRVKYSQYIPEDENSIASALASINDATQMQFIIMIDEWDCVFRNEKDNQQLQKEYINFLRKLFKGNLADRFVALAYITGILPIKKYGTQSALNNFDEFTMIDPDFISKYIGFTENEVAELCNEHNMPFEDLKKWYDGYYFSDIGHIYCPNSVINALETGKLKNYWTQTETYESLKVYIDTDFDGLKQKIVNMLGGDKCEIDYMTFQNDMTTFKSSDDILTLLIHLGYLAYDNSSKTVFIPNEEIRSEFIRAVKAGGWEEVYNAISISEKLLQATLDMDGDSVAKLIQKVHTDNSSSLIYNNEVSLASVIRLAYFTSIRTYTIVRELPTGDGFADMVFIPKRNSDKPAIIVELKWDKTTEGAIEQIKNKNYAEALSDYKGNILLVGINYDKKTRQHQCKIEKAEI